MGLVPKATKAEVKMMYGLNFQRFMGLILTLMLSVAIGDSYVHASFRFLFNVVCIVLFLVLNMKAPANPKRRMWQGFLIWLTGLFMPRRYLSIIGCAFKEARHEH